MVTLAQPRRKVIVVSIAVLAALFLILAAALPRILDPNRYKDSLIASVKESIGRDVTIGGRIDWSLFPLGLRFSKLEVSNVPGFGSEPFARIGKAELKAEILPLLHGKVVIDKVALDGLIVNLARDAAGKTNWGDLFSSKGETKAGPQTSEGAVPDLEIREVDIRGASLAWNDLSGGQRYTLKNLDLKTGHMGGSKPADLEMAVDLEYGQRAKKSRVEIDSTILSEPTGFTLTDFHLKVDDSHMTGSLKLVTDPKPAWDFDFHVDQFNLDRYMPAPQKPGRETKTSSRESPLTVVQGLTGRGKVRFDKLQLFGLRLSDVALEMQAEGGVLRIGPNTASLYSGSYRGHDTISVTGTTPSMKFNEQLKSVQFGPLFKDFRGYDRYSGVANLGIALEARGSTNDQFKRSLTGNVDVLLQNGKIQGVDLQKIIQGTQALSQQIKGKPVPAPTKASDQTLFRRLSASFRVQNGIASTSNIVLDGSSLRASGGGKASLPREVLDFRLSVTLIGANQGKDLTVPVVINGTFDKPAFGVDWGAMAKQAVQKEAEKQIQKGLQNLFKKPKK